MVHTLDAAVLKRQNDEGVIHSETRPSQPSSHISFAGGGRSKLRTTTQAAIARQKKEPSPEDFYPSPEQVRSKVEEILRATAQVARKHGVSTDTFFQYPVFVDPSKINQFESETQKILRQAPHHPLSLERFAQKIAEANNGNTSWSIPEVQSIARLGDSEGAISPKALTNFSTVTRALGEVLAQRKITYARFIEIAREYYLTPDVPIQIPAKKDITPEASRSIKSFFWDTLLQCAHMANYNQDGYLSKHELARAISDDRFQGVHAAMLVTLWDKFEELSSLHPEITLFDAPSAGGTRIRLDGLREFEQPSLTYNRSSSFWFDMTPTKSGFIGQNGGISFTWPELVSGKSNFFSKFQSGFFQQMDSLARQSLETFNTTIPHIETVTSDTVFQRTTNGDCWLVSSLGGLTETDPARLSETLHSGPKNQLLFQAPGKLPFLARKPTEAELLIFSKPSKGGTWQVAYKIFALHSPDAQMTHGSSLPQVRNNNRPDIEAIDGVEGDFVDKMPGLLTGKAYKKLSLDSQTADSVKKLLKRSFENHFPVVVEAYTEDESSPQGILSKKYLGLLEGDGHIYWAVPNGLMNQVTLREPNGINPPFTRKEKPTSPEEMKAAGYIMDPKFPGRFSLPYETLMKHFHSIIVPKEIADSLSK